MKNTLGFIRDALFLATIAMLIEAVLIIFSLRSDDAMVLSKPIFFQILSLSFFTILTRLRKTNHETINMSLIDSRPIHWAKVLKFALFIVFLIIVMRFLGREMNLPYTWSTFLLSTIEAHAVLVATLSELKLKTSVFETQKLIVLIMIGHILSKSLIVMRGKWGN